MIETGKGFHAILSKLLPLLKDYSITGATVVCFTFKLSLSLSVLAEEILD